MVRVESLSDDQLIAKMSALYYMMMSHDGEACWFIWFRVSGLWVAKTGCWFERQAFYDPAFAKSKDKGKERKKKIKSLSKSLDQLNVKGELLSLATSRGFERGLSIHQTKDEFDIMLNKMAPFVPGAQDDLQKLVRPANVLTLRDACVSPLISKESTVTPASKSLDFSSNVVPASSIVASERNKECVNAMVNGPDSEMTEGATHAKSESTFMQHTSYVLDDVAEVTVVGSVHVSSSITDVVVALSAGDKGDGSLPSSATDEEATAKPFGV
nr:hypothetical protein [Tanacetum cinerariifolium]